MIEVKQREAPRARAFILFRAGPVHSGIILRAKPGLVELTRYFDHNTLYYYFQIW